VRIVVCRKPRLLEIQEIPKPLIGPDEALVRIEACALCNGTDFSIFNGTFPYMDQASYPCIMGHESVGRVVDVGEDVLSFSEGDRVLRPMAISETFTSMWGGLAEYGIVVDCEARRARDPKWHPNAVFLSQQVVPDTLGPEEATILITAKETLSWLDRMQFRSGESVLILGSGPVGLMFSRWCAVAGGSPVLVAGRNERTLKRAVRFGAHGTVLTGKDRWEKECWEWGLGQGFDLLIDTTGDRGLLRFCVPLLAPEGRMGLYGVPKAGDGPLVADFAGDWSIWQRSPREWRVHERLVNMVEQKVFHPRDFMTHVLPMDSMERGMALVETRDSIKVVIQIHEIGNGVNPS